MRWDGCVEEQRNSYAARRWRSCADGTLGGIRTPNPQFRRLLLWPLSYEGAENTPDVVSSRRVASPGAFVCLRKYSITRAGIVSIAPKNFAASVKCWPCAACHPWKFSLADTSLVLPCPAYGHCTKPWAQGQRPQTGKTLFSLQSWKFSSKRSQPPQVRQGE